MKKHRITITDQDAKMIVLALQSVLWRNISAPTEHRAAQLTLRLNKLVRLDEPPRAS